MSFEIEKNIPVTDARSTRNVYPFADMEVGDSFFVPVTENIGKVSLGRRLRSAVHNHTKLEGVESTFSVRQYGEGMRVWRVA